ncbi:hypothetical protein HDV02_005381 [Globomyces sp. JEL0801]|nr:hypothetical protein HDV02_005381 [Globomyces sp. JEL0801]
MNEFFNQQKILNVIPAPKYSDGNPEFVGKAASMGFVPIDTYIPSFFKPISLQLIETVRNNISQALIENPQMMNNIAFDHNSALKTLPKNYALMGMAGTTSLLVVGHPRNAQNFYQDTTRSTPSPSNINFPNNGSMNNINGMHAGNIMQGGGMNPAGLGGRLQSPLNSHFEVKQEHYRPTSAPSSQNQSQFMGSQAMNPNMNVQNTAIPQPMNNPYLTNSQNQPKSNQQPSNTTGFNMGNSMQLPQSMNGGNQGNQTTQKLKIQGMGQSGQDQPTPLNTKLEQMNSLPNYIGQMGNQQNIQFMNSRAGNFPMASSPVNTFGNIPQGNTVSINGSLNQFSSNGQFHRHSQATLPSPTVSQGPPSTINPNQQFNTASTNQNVGINPNSVTPNANPSRSVSKQTNITSTFNSASGMSNFTPNEISNIGNLVSGGTSVDTPMDNSSSVQSTDIQDNQPPEKEVKSAVTKPSTTKKEVKPNPGTPSRTNSYALPSNTVVVPVTETAPEDPKFSSKYLNTKLANAKLEKVMNFMTYSQDIQKLKETISLSKVKIERLKFERKLLLTTVNDQDRIKRAKQLSDSSSAGSHSERENDTATELEEDTELDVAEESAPKTKQRKKRRIKLLDPNAPKRPANAFILYCELQRECIKEERRLIHNKEEGSEADTALANLTKALGFRWRSLKDEDRQVYQEMFRDQVKQYDTDIAEYMSTHPNAPLKDDENPGVDYTDPNAPRRPANAFFLFCEMEDERIIRNRTIDRTDEEEASDLAKISLSLGQRWRELTDDERKVYETKYQEQMEIYRKYIEDKKAKSGPSVVESQAPEASSSKTDHVDVEAHEDTGDAHDDAPDTQEDSVKVKSESLEQMNVDE